MAILRNDTTVRSADGQSTSPIITAANIGNYGISTTSTYYIGTTQNVFNRASGAQTLTGVSIDGNAATVTNGVYTTGTQSISGAKTFNDASTFGSNVTLTGASQLFIGSYMSLQSSVSIMGMVGFNRKVSDGTIFNSSYAAYQLHNDTGTLNLQIYTSAGGFVGAHTFNSSGNITFIGSTTSSTDLRAPVFYDTNNTAYYCDPASVSNLNAVTLNRSGSDGYLTLPGSVTVSNVSAAEMVIRGLSQLRFSNSTSWDWNAWAGLRYDNATTTIYLGGPAATGIFTQNATPPTVTVSFVGTNNVTSDSNFKGPIFYDSANTAYYLDPANTGTSLLVAGNVGIGNTSPSAKLHVLGASYTTASAANNNVRFEGSGGNGLGFGTIDATSTYASWIQSGYVPNFATATYALLLNPLGGNVGIGTTSPTVKLDIASTQANGIVMRYDTSTAYYAWIRPYWNSGTDTRIDFAINRTANVTPDVIMSVGYGSNVGIGTTSPSQKLHVVGTGFASTDFRAPIFYDSDNTTYYLDPNASTSGYLAGVLKQNDGKFVRDSYYRTISGFSDYYGSGTSGWYTVASITLTTNCTGGVLYGTLYDHRYDGADAYQISIVARAECDFTTNNESHYVNVGCAISGSTAITNYQSKIRVLLVASSANSRTYEVQFLETAWNRDTWQLETSGSPVWTIYSTAQAPGTSTGTARVFYISNQNADNIRANTASYSPIYYDSANTAYYIDPASTSIVNSFKVYDALYFGDYTTYLSQATPYLRITTANGYGNFGPANSSWFHMTTDRPNFYMAVGLHINGDLFIYNTQSQLTSTSVRAPIFYDSGDTTYYLDPANTGTSLLVAGKVGIGITSPLLKLQVDAAPGNPATTGTTQNGIFRISNSTDNAVLDFGMRAAGAGAWLQSTDETSLAANYPLLLNPNGANVGINNLSADTNLQVVGHVHVGNQTTFDNTGGWSKTIYLDGTYHARLRILGSAYASGKNSQTETYLWVDNTVSPYSGLVTNAGSFTINAGFTTLTNSARSPIFYDSDNTAYYIDAASTSVLNTATISTVQTNAIAKQTNGSPITINSGLNAALGLRVYYDMQLYNTLFFTTSGWGEEGRIYGSSSTVTIQAATATTTFVKYAGYSQEGGSFRAPIFYDSDNTAYYIDAASTSNLNSLVVASSARVGGASSRSTSGLTVGFTDNSTFAANTDVGDTDRMLSIVNESSTTNAMSVLGFRVNPNGGTANAMMDIKFVQTGATNTSALYYTFNHGGTFADRLTIQSSGNIGVNTSDFSYTSSDNSRLVGSNTSNRLFVNGSIQLLNNNDAIVIGRGTATFLSDEELGFGWGGGWYMTDGTYLRVRNDKVLYTAGEIWGSIFKDSNDTTYYIDPANGGFNLRGGNSNRVTFNSGDSGIIVTNAEGISSNVRLGCAWGRPGIYNGSSITVGAETQIDFVIANAVKAYIDSSSNLFANGSVRSPIFYDSNDTTYYTDPASFSLISSLGIGGLTSSNNVQMYDSYVDASSSYLQSPPLIIRKDSSATGAIDQAPVGLFIYNLNGTNNTWTKLSMGNREAAGAGNTVSIAGLAAQKTAGTANAWATGNLHFWTKAGGTQITNMIAYSSGYVQSDYSFRSPIFYDSNDTNYYIDPASTSVINVLQFAANTAQIIGNTTSSYGSLDIRGVRNGWRGIHFNAGGNAPHLMFDGSANGGIYYETGGRWASYYSYGNNCWGFGTSTTNSAYNLYAPTGVYSGGRVDGTIFYDSNDTTYYVDPASTSIMLYVRAANFHDSTGSYNVNLGSGNSEGRGLVAGYSGGSYGGIGYNVRHTTTGGSWIAPSTDTSTYLLFSNGIYFYYAAGGAAGRTLSYSTIGSLTSAGIFTVSGDVRAPIFYDSNNTSYYVDPASTSNLNNLTVAGTMTFGTLAYVTESRRSKNSSNVDIETVTGLVSPSGPTFLEIRGFCPPTMYRTTGDRPAPYGLGFGNGSESGGIMPIGAGDNLQEIMLYGANSGPTTFTFKRQIWEAATYDPSYSNYYGSAVFSINTGTGAVTASTDIRSPIFYDSNDTNYYVDPASTSNILELKTNKNWYDTSASVWGGGINMGGNNPSIGFQSTASTWWFMLHHSSDSINFYRRSTSGGWNQDCIWDSSGNFIWRNGSIRAPIFYDFNNTSYYLDPASTSNLNVVNLVGITGAGAAYIQSTSTGTSYSNHIQIRESSGGGGNTSEIYAPALGFHWSGVVASNILMESSGRIAIRNNPGSGYENFIANAIYGAVFYDSNDTTYYTDPASTSILNRINYQQLRRNFASSVYSGTPGGSNNVKTFSGVLVAGSANGTNNAYTVIETSIPQDNYQMGGFTINWFENYSSTNAKTTVEIAGYWNPTSNGGFIGFEYTTSNPNVQPTIRVGRNSSGNTVFILDHFSSNYTVIIARDLWLGYNSSDGEWATGWTMTNTTSIAAYSNVVSAVLRVGPTLTGTGASGTWGISITGSSASCTGNSATATTASSCSGNSATATTATNAGCVTSDTGNVGDSRLQYWQTSGNTTLNPDTEWYNAIRMGHGNPVTYYSNTLAVKMTGSNLGDIYTRTTTNGTAGTWNRFWNNNNDGAGSGLDADLLDGINSASFLRSDVSATNSVDLRSPIFYDSSNTAYYLDPASQSKLYNLLIETGTANTSMTIVGSNQPSIFLKTTDNARNIEIFNSYGNFGIYRSNAPSNYIIYHVDNGASSSTEMQLQGAARLTINSNGLTAATSVRSPIFYDSDDTNYYVDAASTSRLNLLRTRNTFGERITVTSAASTTVDTQYNLTELTMSASITTLTLSNIQASTIVHMWTIVTVGNGTAYSITWPAAVKWPGGTAPTITSTNTKRDIYQFVTYDGGTTIYAIIVGQNL